MGASHPGAARYALGYCTIVKNGFVWRKKIGARKNAKDARGVVWNGAGGGNVVRCRRWDAAPDEVVVGLRWNIMRKSIAHMFYPVKL